MQHLGFNSIHSATGTTMATSIDIGTHKKKGKTCIPDEEEKPACAKHIGEIVQEQLNRVKNMTAPLLPS